MRASSVVLAALMILSGPMMAQAAGPDYRDGLRPPLGDVLAAASPGQLVPVSVVFREQATNERLRDAGAGLERHAARRIRLDLLKEIAHRSQAPLLAALREWEGQGQVARVRPLWIGNVVGVEATPAAIRAIAARPEVAWVNHNPKADVLLGDFSPAPAEQVRKSPRPPSYGANEIECGVEKMRAPSVWNELANTGQGAVIAVIDTGLCWTHSDIANQVWVNPGEDLNHNSVVMDPADVNGVDDDANGFVDDLIGWDFDNGDREPNDDNSHGSHCAGTVAGDGTAGTQAGMAPDAKIMAVKVGVTFADEVDVWSAMQYAADNGADAISMSLGWPHGQNPDRATWRQNCENTIEAGTAMVIAAGNEGSGAEPDNVRTPGDVPRVITVGATDCSDYAAGFSSRGPVSWQNVPPYNDYPYPPGLIKPDISAPGVDTKSHYVCSGYTFMSGTSMATPHVAGAVALMVSASPGIGHDDIKQILEETAVDLGDPGKDNTFGSGRVDAYQAVQNIANPNGRVLIREISVSCNGTLTLQVSDSDLKGTGTVAVDVFSSTEAVPEPAVLSETGPASGVFRGFIATDGGPVSPDGRVQVRNADVITAHYVDANDGQGGTNVVKTDTALADCQGPLISQVAETDITDVSARIVWQTDELSTSVVTWGETRPPGNETSSAGNTLSHSVQLTGLRACTVYYFSVRSADQPGNATTDSNGGLYHYFETYGDFGEGLQPCHAGRLTLPESIVSCSDTLPIKLVDLDLNLDPAAPNTVRVSVSSSSETIPETVTLTETGPNTSQFTGSITTSSGPVVNGDSILQVSGGDVVSATYHDADDGTGVGAVSFDSGDVDCAGPAFSNVRVTDITDDSAVVRWNTSEPGTSRVNWGTTAALGNVVTDPALTTTHALTLRTFSECGRIYFSATSADVYGNTRVFDAAGIPLEFNAYRIPGLFRDEFETSTGWTLSGEWQIQAPQGRGTSPGDPTTAFQGAKVLGLDLSGLGSKPGDYEPNSDTRAASPVINASTLGGGQLKFRRWLNVGGGAVAYVEVWKNGVWNSVWNSSSVSGVTESEWSFETVDISAFADANPQLQIAFRIRAGLSSTSNRAGWNVDRFVVKSAAQPDFDVCGSCGGAPTFAGVESAQDVDGCSDSGVRLSWKEAPAWGTGRGGSYAVYRSTDPSFVPSPSNLVVAGLTATTYTDLAAPNGVTLYYVVRAENDESCSTGPRNGGVVDPNLVRLAARDDLSQPSPGNVGTSLRLSNLNDAQLRLSWSPAPTAARYHVYRADIPQGPFARIADVTETEFDDRDELGNLNARYYLVKPADSCGNE
jgi:serine protease AprX